VLPFTSQQHTTITTLDGKPYKLSSKNALIGRTTAHSPQDRYTAKRASVWWLTPSAVNTMCSGDAARHDRWWDAADILDLAFAHAHNTH